MNSHVKALIKTRNKWHHRYKLIPSDHNHGIYLYKREQNQILHSNLRDKLCNLNTNSKQYWHLLKSLYGTKLDAGIPSIIEGNDVISSSTEKAELFNRHFSEEINSSK